MELDFRHINPTIVHNVVIYSSLNLKKKTLCFDRKTLIESFHFMELFCFKE